jgi:putrescine transport system ATP-binding protein
MVEIPCEGLADASIADRPPSASGRETSHPFSGAARSAKRESMPEPPAKPLISFVGTRKAFGSVVAVDRVSLDIAEGEFFTLLGPSGCGKTTLMRMLAGFEDPDSGDVRLGGASLIGTPAHKRPVNMMFQSYALFPHMSVAANIGFGPRMAGWSRAAIDRRVDELLALVRLEGVGARRPDQLSGGQRQRVALARALALKPKVLLLDEPLGALDRRLRDETGQELKRIQRELGTTFIVVTHDQEEAMSLSDRIAVLRSGRIVQVGTPSTIYEQPANVFVARFVGDIGLLACTILERDGDRLRLRHEGSGAMLTVAGPSIMADGCPVFLGLRPERIVLGPAQTHDNALPAVVVATSYHGDATIVHVRTADGEMLKVRRASKGRGVAQDPETGDKVTLHFAADAGILLEEADAST